MKKMLKMKTLAAAVVLASGSMAAQAAPIAADGTLSIAQGSGSAPNTPCPGGGSCFGMEVAPGFVIWTDFAGGTDGGIIVGKDQASGGQENAPSPTNTTIGELTTSWLFFSNYGTFATPTGSTNVYDDASCAGASCIGATDLNSWNVAWNGVSVPMGSATGCNSITSCSADQNAGIFITNYTMAAGGNGAYSMAYGNVVPDGDASGFGNVKFSMVLAGTATNVQATATFTPTFTPTATATATFTPTATATATFTPTVTPIGPTPTFTPTYTPTPTLPPTATFTPTFTPTPTTAPLTCEETYPLATVTTIGGGQSRTVNESMQATFVGHITTAIAGGKNSVKICPGSSVQYEVTSSVGTARCTIQSAAAASAGTLSLGDKMICTNKPDGSDTDRFTIKSGI